MLGQRRRRWANIEAELAQCLVFTVCVPLLSARFNIGFMVGQCLKR